MADSEYQAIVIETAEWHRVLGASNLTDHLTEGKALHEIEKMIRRGGVCVLNIARFDPLDGGLNSVDGVAHGTCVKDNKGWRQAR